MAAVQRVYQRQLHSLPLLLDAVLNRQSEGERKSRAREGRRNTISLFFRSSPLSPPNALRCALSLYHWLMPPLCLSQCLPFSPFLLRRLCSCICLSFVVLPRSLPLPPSPLLWLRPSRCLGTLPTLLSSAFLLSRSALPRCPRGLFFSSPAFLLLLTISRLAPFCSFPSSLSPIRTLSTTQPLHISTPNRSSPPQLLGLLSLRVSSLSLPRVMRLLVALSLLLAGLLPHGALSLSLYVDAEHGSDANSGTSPAQAFKTPLRAIQALESRATKGERARQHEREQDGEAPRR